jgi:hypothetical protein
MPTNTGVWASASSHQLIPVGGDRRGKLLAALPELVVARSCSSPPKAPLARLLADLQAPGRASPGPLSCVRGAPWHSPLLLSTLAPSFGTVYERPIRWFWGSWFSLRGAGRQGPARSVSANSRAIPCRVVIDTLREVVEQLCAMHRPPCSPGERQAAEWLAERLLRAGAAAVELEDEPSWGQFPPLSTAIGGGWTRPRGSQPWRSTPRAPGRPAAG